VFFSILTSNVVYAQLYVGNTSDKTQLATLGLSSPFIYKNSDKGIYNVTIKSGESSPSSGLNFEIVFLNASSSNLKGTPPNASSTETEVTTVPAVIEHVIPVKSFDMRIISTDGKELSKKISEVPRGGRILENINLNNYTGNISINLTNIVPDPSIVDIVKKQLKVLSKQSDLRDSINIEAQVTKS
jgi:hypothetical protein